MIFDIGSLYAYLEEIEDTRKAKGRRYELITLLVLLLLAKMGGEDRPSGIAEWIANRKDVWVEYKLIGKPQTVRHMTYRRILQTTISAEAFALGESLSVRAEHIELDHTADFLQHYVGAMALKP